MTINSNNVMTRLPKRGDLEVRRKADRKPFYIIAETINNASIDTSTYEVIGPVLEVKDGKVLTAYKENSNQVWCNRAWWYLSGMVLDGAEHTGVLAFRFSSNSWNENINKTVTYKASTAQEFVQKLNQFLTTDIDFISQDAYANVESDGRVRIHVNNTDWRQCAYNTANSGFTLSGSLPEIAVLANMRRKHGGNGGEGAISSWDRALAYYRNDNGQDVYMGGRTSAQTSVKQSYPINLPTWLGTSTQNPGNFCTDLHAIYGTGEAGWLKFMTSCLPVHDTDMGNMGQDFGKEMTALLKSFMYTSTKQTTPAHICNAAAYCYNKESLTFDRGTFHLPTPKEVQTLLDGIHYGTSRDRNSDIVNSTLSKIGGSSISNGSNFWSCSRCYAHNAWHAHGSYGFFDGSNMYSSVLCVPVSLHELNS